MNFGLQGRVAIVTGASKGIGKAIAKLLVQEGVKVVMCARGVKQLERTKKEISKKGRSVLAVAADVTTDQGVCNVIESTIKTFGKLDILINNVGGVNRFGGFLELSDADWQDAFNLNVMSIVNFVRKALPYLKRSQSPRIINISSISGIQPGFYNPHYSVVKAAVINLSKYFSNIFANSKILVNVVCVGNTESDSRNRLIQHIAKIRNISLKEARAQVEKEEANKIPLGKVGKGSDVAGLVTLLASDNASWITGSCFHINGGRLQSMS